MNQDKYCALHIGDDVILLDFCDLAVVDPFNIHWTVIRKGNVKYVTAHILIDGISKNIYMHRLILGDPSGTVDHIDRDGLNNRRKNLRVGSQFANVVNSGPRKRGKSKYKGVSWHGQSKKWRATIQAKGKWQLVGLFLTEEDAARAYDKVAAELQGPTAYLNSSEFPL